MCHPLDFVVALISLRSPGTKKQKKELKKKLLKKTSIQARFPTIALWNLSLFAYALLY